MEQLYIGVDLHSRFFQACAVTGSGERRWEERFMRTDPGFEQSAAAVIDQHARRRAVFPRRRTGATSQPTPSSLRQGAPVHRRYGHVEDA